MYENLYYFDEEVYGKTVWILVKPNFREAITRFNGKNKIFSDGKIRMEGRAVGQGKHPDVYVSEDAQWALEDNNGYGYKIYVTERTEKITTPLGEEWNTQFNRLLKECKSEYYQSKKKEIRLYFYEANSDKLQLSCLGDYYWSCAWTCDYSYQLRRGYPKISYCAIDKRYAKPEKDCFILGRVRKTIGLKNSKLLDFIEPVHEISLDFEKDEDDFGGYEYKAKKECLEENLFDLLKFSIAKKYDVLEIMRIRAYLQNNSDEQDIVISQFKNEIWEAFKENNVQKVYQLYDVLNEPQDCTNVKFELRLEEEITCEPGKRLTVFFVNGESDYLPAQWIYKNIHNCTDANGKYLGEIRNRYNFY